METHTDQEYDSGPQETGDDDDGGGEIVRPRTRGECAGVPRPCPFVSCKYNLYLDVIRGRGGREYVKINRKCDPLEVPPDESCALDVADRVAQCGEEGSVTRMSESFRTTRWCMHLIMLRAIARAGDSMEKLGVFRGDEEMSAKRMSRRAAGLAPSTSLPSTAGRHGKPRFAHCAEAISDRLSPGVPERASVMVKFASDLGYSQCVIKHARDAVGVTTFRSGTVWWWVKNGT